MYGGLWHCTRGSDQGHPSQGNRQEGWGAPSGGNRLQVSDFLNFSCKQQKETNYKCWTFFPSLYKIKRFVLKFCFAMTTPGSTWNKLFSNLELTNEFFFSSVQFSCSVVSNSLWLHGLQHTRTPYPSPTPRVYPLMSIVSLMPSNHLILCCFFSCPQSFPATGSFPMSQFFPSGGQSNGVSASTSVLPMNTQDWSPLGWTGWISL